VSQVAFSASALKPEVARQLLSRTSQLGVAAAAGIGTEAARRLPKTAAANTNLATALPLPVKARTPGNLVNTP